MTNYVEMDPLALNRLAAERAGWRDVHVKSYTHAREMWGYPPGVEPGYKNYEIVPDYTGSVDAALTWLAAMGLDDGWMLEKARPHEYNARLWGDALPDPYEDYILEQQARPALALVIAGLRADDARAGKGEGNDE